MTTASRYACPDCHEPTDRRRRSQDARCDDCRTQVGRRHQRGPVSTRMAIVRRVGSGRMP
jgi:ribosomal protein L37AE/L43A